MKKKGFRAFWKNPKFQGFQMFALLVSKWTGFGSDKFNVGYPKECMGLWWDDAKHFKERK